MLEVEKVIPKKLDCTPNYDWLYPKRWHPYYYVLSGLTTRIKQFSIDYISKMTDPVLLDMGCGETPYRPILEPIISKYVGVDIADNQQADIHISSDGQVPLRDSCADIVLSTQVLEHVASPSNYLSECYRLLKPGGLIILSTHGYWCYHPVPTDFWRWTGPGLNKVVQEAGFQIIECQGIMSLASSAMQLLQFSTEEKAPKLRLFKNFFTF